MPERDKPSVMTRHYPLHCHNADSPVESWLLLPPAVQSEVDSMLFLYFPKKQAKIYQSLLICRNYSVIVLYYFTLASADVQYIVESSFILLICQQRFTRRSPSSAAEESSAPFLLLIKY